LILQAPLQTVLLCFIKKVPEKYMPVVHMQCSGILEPVQLPIGFFAIQTNVSDNVTAPCPFKSIIVEPPYSVSNSLDVYTWLVVK
jgi:hypothetical protein